MAQTTQERFLRTVRKSGSSLAVHIPPEVASVMSIKEGDMVRIEINLIKNTKRT